MEAKERSGKTRGRFRAVAAFALAAILGACVQSNPEAEQAAFEASQPWLRLMDEGDYAGCWEAAAPLFRSRETQQGWTAKAQGYREPLGSLRSRRLNKASYLVDPWGAPPGEYVAVVYDSLWQGGTIYESVNMRKQADGSWLTVGYDVQQQ